MNERTASPELLRRLAVRPEIEPETEVRARVRFLRRYLEASGETTLWLAVSGGVDSALAGRLCSLAVLGPVRRFRFVAVRLPYGRQRDEEQAERVLEWIRPSEVVRVDIAPAVAALETALPGERLRAHSPGERDLARGNTKARMRMAAQYYLANLEGGLVVGTDHAAEAVVGFFTKFGDGAADLAPLFGLGKRQVRRLAVHLGAPPEIVRKTPTADLEDLRPGFPDEEALGVTYRELDDFLEGRPVTASAAERIEAIYRATEHKRRGPVTPGERWWRRRVSSAAEGR